MNDLRDSAGAGRVCEDGSWTISHAVELKEMLSSELRRNGSFDIDLSKVSELDIAGVQLLLAAMRSATDAGGCIRLVEANDTVAKTFGLIGLSAQLHASPSPDDVMAGAA